jgi:hypothetical protein
MKIQVTEEHAKKATRYSDPFDCLLSTAVKDHLDKAGIDYKIVVTTRGSTTIDQKDYTHPEWCDDWSYAYFTPEYKDAVCVFPFEMELTELTQQDQSHNTLGHQNETNNYRSSLR